MRSCACTLFILSFFVCGTLEGMFGMAAAMAVLCCAHPSVLGVAHASKCAKCAATMCAILGMFHLTILSFFAFAVMPEVPQAVQASCANGATPESFYESLSMGLAPHAGAHPPHPHEGHAHDGHPHHPVAFPTTSKDAAYVVGNVATHASRKLTEVYQVIVMGEVEVAPPPVDAHCEKVAHFFDETAPILLLLIALMQFCLILASLNLSKAAGRLILAARARGVRNM